MAARLRPVRELHPDVLHERDLSRRVKDVAVFAQGIPGGIRVLTPAGWSWSPAIGTR